MSTHEEISGRGTPIYIDLLDFYREVHESIETPCGQSRDYEPHIPEETDTNLRLEIPLNKELKTAAQDILAISQARFDWAFDSARYPPENVPEGCSKKVLYGMMLYKVQETLPGLNEKLDETIKATTHGIARKHSLEELQKLDGVFEESILYPLSVMTLVGAIKLHGGDYRAIVEKCNDSKITHKPVDYLVKILGVDTD